MWQRYAVTRLALAQRAHLQGVLADRGIRIDCVFVGDDANLDAAVEHGFDVVEQNNDFLGRKFNDGIEYALDHGADVVVLLGSDDWIHEDCFDRLPLDEHPRPEGDEWVWRPGPEIVTGHGITIVDLPTGRIRRCQSRTKRGSIPWLISRAALEPSGGRPIPETKQRGTDFALAMGLGVRPVWVEHDPHELCRVDLKSGTNMNSFEDTSGALADGPLLHNAWEILAKKYPAHLVEMAQETHLALAA